MTHSAGAVRAEKRIDNITIAKKKVFFDVVIVHRRGNDIDDKDYTKINISGYPVKIDEYPNIKFVVHNTVDIYSIIGQCKGLWNMSELTTGAGLLIDETTETSKVKAIEAVITKLHEKGITEEHILIGMKKVRTELS
jgi:hypothetical protein